MKYRREEIMPGVFLSAVNTDRFKTAVMGAVLLSQLEREHAYMDALLPSVLRRGTVKSPDMPALTRRLEMLYGAVVVPVIQTVGEVRCSGFLGTFPENRFLPGGARELESMAALLGELLIAPNKRGGLLLPEYVDSEKAKLAERIRSARDDREGYAMQRLIALMCQYEDMGAMVLDDEDEAESIHYRRLTMRWRELLSRSPVEVFYCGSEDFRSVRDAVLDAFAALPRGELDFDIGTDVRMNAIEAEPRIYNETMDAAQGKLCMGWRLGECMEEPDPAALRVFNAVYGGTAASRLFRRLREERSLCYYASSGVDIVKGLLYVQSGIDPSSYNEAVGAITGELAAMARDGIGPEELDAARSYCAQALRLIVDDPIELMMYRLRMNVTGADIAPDELAALCEEVSAESVADIAASTELDAVYFLSGEEDVAE